MNYSKNGKRTTQPKKAGTYWCTVLVGRGKNPKVIERLVEYRQVGQQMRWLIEPGAIVDTWSS